MSEAIRVGRDDASVGLLKLLGIALEQAGPDGVTLCMQIGPEHLQPHGVLHGGVHATLVESAASIAGHLWISGQQPGGTVVGVNNNTDFLRPARTGALRAVAEPIHRGRSQQLWLVRITDEADKLIARGQVRLHNIVRS